MNELDEKKSKLNQYRKLKNMADWLDKQARELGERAASTGSKKMSDMPRGGKKETMEDLLTEKVDVEKRRDRFNVKAKEARSVVQGYIDTVTSPQHNALLKGLYIDRLSVGEIAERDGYSERQEWRIYKEAHRMVDVSDVSEGCQ